MLSQLDQVRQDLRGILEPCDNDAVIERLIVFIEEQVQDTLTSAMHPEFGWWWRPEEDGGKALREEYVRGYYDHEAGKPLEPVQ